MKFTLGSIGPHTAVDLLAVMLSEEDLARSPLLDALDSALGGAVRTAISDEEFTAKKDSALTVVTYGRATPRKVLLLGLGPEAKVTQVEVRAAAAPAPPARPTPRRPPRWASRSPTASRRRSSRRRSARPWAPTASRATSPATGAPRRSWSG